MLVATQAVDAIRGIDGGDLAERGNGSGVEAPHEFGSRCGLVVVPIYRRLFAWPRPGPAIYRPLVLTVHGVGTKYARPFQDACVRVLVQLMQLVWQPFVFETASVREAEQRRVLAAVQLCCDGAGYGIVNFAVFGPRRLDPEPYSSFVGA